MSRFYKSVLMIMCLLLIQTGLGSMAARDGGAAVMLSRSRAASVMKAAAKEPDWKARVEKPDWFEEGSRILKKGKHGYIYDIDTGIVVHIKRMGGTNHAECEPASRSDAAKLKKISGGSYNEDSHAVILYAGGRFAACAISTQPHGKQSISGNGYEGCFCLYMLNSRGHADAGVVEAHQRSVARAYKWAQEG